MISLSSKKGVYLGEDNSQNKIRSQVPQAQRQSLVNKIAKFIRFNNPNYRQDESLMSDERS